MRRGGSIAIRLGIGLAVLAGCGRVQAQSQAPVPVETTYLGLDVAPASGALTLRVHDAAGREVYRTEAPELRLDGVRQTGFTVVAQEPLRLQNERLEVVFEVLGDRAVAVTWTGRDRARHDFALHLRSDDPTAYYGTGERFNALNQRGYYLPMVSDDRYGNKGVGTHKPIPFVMSTRGFGVWVDSFAPGAFDLDAGERFGTVFRYPETAFRVVFIAGPKLTDLLATFTELTGRPPVPPPWAFGLWKSRDVHHNQDSVMVDVEKLRRLGIPASVLVLDSPWETGYNDFTINRQQFADPEAMFRSIEAAGLVLCLWLTPFVNNRNVIDMQDITPASSNFDEAADAGYLVADSTGAVAVMPWWKGEGGLVDFTNPEATAWWHAQLLKTKAYGARAFKADDGEGNFVPDAVFHDGADAAEMKNRYGTLYNAAMQRYIDTQLGGDGVLITRSGTTGTQRYPFAWAGDNRADFSFDNGLPSVILAGQQAALSGIALWGSDIAGYAGTPTKELFIRWTQLGTFTPLMQIHMTSNLGPWDFDAETLDIFRQYAVLRTQLFPYLYDAVHEAARTGLPIIRPMVLAFQEDPEARRHPYQYLFGPDLLVAPVYQPGARRSVYLPEGIWYDYWTGAAHAGPQIVEVAAPLDRIPLFVRAGALIPMLPADVQTLLPRHENMDPAVTALDDRRMVQVWPGAAGMLATWDGLGATLIREGAQATLRLSSTGPRPLEVHLLHRRLTGLAVEGAGVAYDAARAATVVTFPRFEGARTLTWQEPQR